MIPLVKGIYNFAFQHYDGVESGPSFAEVTLKQRNASVLFQPINESDFDNTFLCLTKAFSSQLSVDS
ncbi:hypothetical protein TNCV_3908561 [Trichonephila clavipes]|nr:hypothetical protein TNCV_3908561 [Trichonephila clavipes]